MKSKIVTSPQDDIHNDLESIVRRYNESQYLRPIDPTAEQEFSHVLQQLQSFKGMILDSCCGVGESSFHQAMENPDYLVLGVDKSAHRLERKNRFKQELPLNLIYLKGNIIDYWCLAFQHQKYIELKQVNLFFPNPYPKADQIKKRWHGHPIGKVLFELGCRIELRTNWKIYQREFEYVAQLNHRQIESSEEYLPKKIVTPFERKYHDSGHVLFKTCIAPFQGD